MVDAEQDGRAGQSHPDWILPTFSAHSKPPPSKNCGQSQNSRTEHEGKNRSQRYAGEPAHQGARVYSKERVLRGQLTRLRAPTFDHQPHSAHHAARPLRQNSEHRHVQQCRDGQTGHDRPSASSRKHQNRQRHAEIRLQQRHSERECAQGDAGAGHGEGGVYCEHDDHRDVPLE